ncbi:hypothetical protein KY290_007336 [Solanum tuberosum]|uniref:Ulp1 protease family, C-terminal catalytic domain containing protein n=1 Tax=Solanum tuberosum TaxID=4113 RepID=A0ABQ7W5S1_SOLTU|nr:hypothetical protein KY290_007336 [Solanum tuberosum]
MSKNQKHQHTLRKSPDSLEGVSNVEIEASSFNNLTQTPPTNRNVNPANKSVTTPKKKQTPTKFFTDCGMYTCLFVEYISNGVFDIGPIDIDAKYHRQRYATILWQYGRSKNVDGTISESEVTETVASKFGGPRIAKEHAPNITNILSYTKTMKNKFEIVNCSLDF